MTAKILRIVNSAYFGFRSKISDPVLAVRFLGINTVSSLVMACHIFKHADPALADWLGLNRMWSHSLLTSQWAKKIAECETKDRNTVDDALAAGMLHDVGRLVLAINFPDTYKILIEHARSAREDLIELESSVIGVTHAEIGAYLMGTWGLRNAIVEAIAYHHEPGKCEHREFVPLTAVHAACGLEKESCANDPDPREVLDAQYLESRGFTSKLEGWRALCEDRPAEETILNE
jgi:putative nucleotidyltransferase with HDIG domain